MSRKDEPNWLTIEDRRCLEDGLKLFRANYAVDGGRSGMLTALHGVLGYIMRVVPAQDIDVDVLKPLLHLERALYDLDRTGNRAACLEGRNPGNADNDPVIDLKASALAISDVLKSLAKYSREDADSRAATIVSKAAMTLGVKLPRDRNRIDATSVRSWRRGARPRGRGSDAVALRLADRKASVRREIARKVLELGQQNAHVDLGDIIENVVNPDPREWPDWPGAQ